MERISTFTVVAAALVDARDKVLLQQRLPGRSMAGLWEFPGGKVEDGERPEEALVRELKEELGIDVDAAALSPAAFASADNAGRHMLLLLYTCKTWRGEPQPRDAAGLQWLAPAEMNVLDMPPADKPLVEILKLLIETFKTSA